MNLVPQASRAEGERQTMGKEEAGMVDDEQYSPRHDQRRSMSAQSTSCP